MAAKKAPAKKMAAPKPPAPKPSSQKNKVTSNIPSPIMPRPDIKIFHTKNPVGIASAATVKTVLGGASLAGKIIRKATPLPDKPGRAVPTQPSRMAYGGFGNPLVVPTAQLRRTTSNVTKKAAPKKK